MNFNMPLLNRAEFEEENTNLTDVLESMDCYVEAFWLHTEEVVSPDGTVILTNEEAAYDNDMDYEANLEHIAYMITKKAESGTASSMPVRPPRAVPQKNTERMIARGWRPVAWPMMRGVMK